MKNIKHLPAYQRIRKDVARKIETGTWPPGTKLPPEPDLQRLYGGVSRGTIRRALLDLEIQSCIRRSQGKGTFVTGPLQRVSYELESGSFSQQVARAGLIARSKVLRKGCIRGSEAGEFVCQAFGLGIDDCVILIERLRLREEEPLAIQTVFLLPERCPQILEESFGSLYEILATKYGITITEVRETLRVLPPSTREAEMLNLHDEYIVFRERISFDQDAKPIEVLHSSEAASKFVYNYRIVGDGTHVLVEPPIKARASL
jgi:GntR family transcriptional regulator